MEDQVTSLRRYMPLLVAVVAVLLISSFLSSRGAAKPDASKYQAVFLTNNQVYFGKFQNPESEYPLLTDVYYLRKNPQAGEEQATPQAPLSLIKFGNEIHGPEDAMYIAREQILFWENLKADSSVVKKIEQEKEQKTEANTAKPTPAATATPVNP